MAGANDRFLVNPTIRWRGQEWLLRVDLSGSIAARRTTGSGRKRGIQGGRRHQQGCEPVVADAGGDRADAR